MKNRREIVKIIQVRQFVKSGVPSAKAALFVDLLDARYGFGRWTLTPAGVVVGRAVVLKSLEALLPLADVAPTPAMLGVPFTAPEGDTSLIVEATETVVEETTRVKTEKRASSQKKNWYTERDVVASKTAKKQKRK
jgi:hypothetical protein